MGSGKSRVADEFRRRGAPVISGDALGHEALRQPEIRNRLIERWGERVLNERGEVDRSKVAAIVFADPEELKALETLVHPWIGARVREEVAATDAPLVVLDAAVLLEAGWQDACDTIVFVHAPRDVRLER